MSTSSADPRIQRRDLIVEIRPVGHAPANPGILHARGCGERSSDGTARPRGGEAHHAAFATVEVVAKRRAHRLHHAAPDVRPAPERDFGEERVVDVAAEQADRGRRLPAPPGRDVLEQPRHAVHHEDGQRRADQQVLDIADALLLEPLPFVVVDHRALVLVMPMARVAQHTPGAGVDHDQSHRPPVAAIAPARTLHVVLGTARELAQERPGITRSAHAVEPALGDVPVVVHVVVVPDHRARDGRERPSWFEPRRHHERASRGFGSLTSR